MRVVAEPLDGEKDVELELGEVSSARHADILLIWKEIVNRFRCRRADIPLDEHPHYQDVANPPEVRKRQVAYRRCQASKTEV
jgi:hypothetical protein